MSFRLRFLSILLLVLTATMPAHASVKTDGLLEATHQCPANKKLRSDNPGGVVLDPGEIYEVIGLNSKTPSHALVVIPGAPVTEQRWVSVNCGELALDDETIMVKQDPDFVAPVVKKVEKPADPSRIENLLAASWLPTFCLTGAGENARECRNLDKGDIYARQFSIHGLWPNDLDDVALYPCYCHLERPIACNRREPAFSSISISDDLREELQDKMPGIQSGFLHRHEWTKHGTCYEKYNKGEGQGADAEEYYRDTIHVIDQLNRSEVGRLFAANIGKNLSAKQIFSSFEKSFGTGASDRVFIDCKTIGGERYISELFIGLGAEITPDSDLAELIATSPTRYDYTKQKSCTGGRVTAVP